MTTSKVGQELSKSACVLLGRSVIKEMVKTRIILDFLEHSESNLCNLFIPANFLLHCKFTSGLILLLFLADLKLLSLILNHDHISELLEHVNHFSQSIDL